MRVKTGAVSTVAAVILIALLGACAGSPKLPERPECAHATGDGLQAVFKQVSDGQLAEAYPSLTTIIDCPQFGQLESGLRHSALVIAGFVAIDLDKPAEGHALLVRSSAMPEAGADDWIGRLDAARHLGLRADAIESLTQLARRHPEMVQELNYRVVLEVVRSGGGLAEAGSAMHELLDSLFTAAWTLPDGIQPSFLWRDLAAIELERQNLRRAQEVVGRVQSPHAIVSMRIDRRFDPLRDAMPRHYDVDGAVSSELLTLYEIAQGSPRSMDALVQLTYALLDARRYEDVLGITGDVLRIIERASGMEAPYDDMDMEIWILDNRARALAALQRWGEAEATLRAAALGREDGSRNVSQVINLAWFYAEAGRGDEALATLRDVGPEMSPYGLMQMHGARHAAALQTGDDAIAGESFAYLRKHQDDALKTWQWTLVRANLLDEAAALLIERLGDPMKRGDALRELQDYANPPPASQRDLWNARWAQIRGRDDVKRAVDAVGRIESFQIAQAGD